MRSLRFALLKKSETDSEGLLDVCTKFLEALDNEIFTPAVQELYRPVQWVMLGCVAVMSPVPQFMGSSLTHVDYVCPEKSVRRGSSGGAPILQDLKKCGQTIVFITKAPNSSWLSQVQAYRVGFSTSMVAAESFTTMLTHIDDYMQDENDRDLDRDIIEYFITHIDSEWKGLREAAKIMVEEKLDECFYEEFDCLQNEGKQGTLSPDKINLVKRMSEACSKASTRKLQEMGHTMTEKLMVWSEESNSSRFLTTLSTFTNNANMDNLIAITSSLQVATSQAGFLTKNEGAGKGMAEAVRATLKLLLPLMNTESTESDIPTRVKSLVDLCSFWSKINSYKDFANVQGASQVLVSMKAFHKAAKAGADVMTFTDQAKVALEQGSEMAKVVIALQNAVNQAFQFVAKPSAPSDKSLQQDMTSITGHLRLIADVGKERLQQAALKWAEQVNETLKIRIQRLDKVARGTSDGTHWAAKGGSKNEVHGHNERRSPTSWLPWPGLAQTKQSTLVGQPQVHGRGCDPRSP